MPPHFTVITPVLNGLVDVNGYVKNLQEQTFTDWEAIVVDDGSTDGSIELLREVTRCDRRFHITCNTLPRKVKGPYQARNVGLSMARGRFVCFLDIDDRWLANKLEEQAEDFIKKPQLRMHYTSYIRTRRGTVTGKIRHAPPLLGPHAWIHVINPVPMLTACVERSAIAELVFEPLHHEDYIFWSRVLGRIGPHEIKVSGHALAAYIIHSKSISSNKLRAIEWIWLCYRHLGYSRIKAVAALFARGIFQAYVAITEATRAEYCLNQELEHGDESI
jgi:teichuronic acid biosynthesis glycosyltransferase TuaG